MASLQSMKGWRMSFIIIWKVAGKLHNPKNMMSGSKSQSPQFVEKAAFHSSPSLSWTLLKPQLSQLMMGCVTCHTCHGCVTHFRPILGNIVEVTLVTFPILYIVSHAKGTSFP